MAEPFGHEYRVPVLLGEFYGGPAPVTRRSDPDVDDHVHDRPGRTDHVFCLTRRHVAEVDPADHAPFGDRAIRLDDPQIPGRSHHNPATSKPLVKFSKLIRMNFSRA